MTETEPSDSAPPSTTCNAAATQEDASKPTTGTVPTEVIAAAQTMADQRTASAKQLASEVASPDTIKHLVDEPYRTRSVRPNPPLAP